MRRIITLTFLSLALLGGVALADNRRIDRVEHNELRRENRAEVYRDFHARPARFEHREARLEHRWARGERGRRNWESGRNIRGRR